MPLSMEEEEAMAIPASPKESPLDVLEFDPDYEFDAARFFDFTLPESPSEEEEAERWFDRAPSYPPSPFIAKICRGGVPLSLDNVNKAQDLESQHDRRPINNNAVTEEAVVVSGINPCDHEVADQDPPPRAAAKLRSQSYMKPTASYLAKQNQDQEFRFHRILRSQNVVEDHKTSSNSSSSNETQATKRQKLDIGYLQKIIHAKPRSPLQHKVAKMERKADDCTLGRPKVTIPREFSFETARRAMRHRAKNENISIGRTTSNFRTSKTCVSNHKDLKIPAAKHPLPVELFKNLFIDSEVQPSYQSMSHVSTVDTKLNMQLVLKQGHEMMDMILSNRCGGGNGETFEIFSKAIPVQEDMGISDHRPQPNFNRDYFYLNLF